MLNIPKKDGNNKNSIWKSKPKKYIIWIYAVVIGVMIFIQFASSSNSGQRISYSDFLDYVKRGYVDEVTIKNNTVIEGKYNDAAIEDGIVNLNETTWNFWGDSEHLLFTTNIIEGDEIRPILEEYKVKFDAKQEQDWFGNMLFWLFPLFLIIIFWMFIFRRMNPGQQVMSIRKSGASLYDKQSNQKISFKDVAGLEEAKVEVEEIVDFLRNPQKYTALGGTIPKGVLIVGPPGTGKTLLAKATAGEADVPFFSMTGSDFVEMFVGVGAARVRDLFKQAKSKAPCIIFIDEIDAIGRTRGRGMTLGSNDERENTLNQLLSEMDGFNSDKGVIIMAATNRPDVLDTALLRPGRFDRQIMVERPDLNGRIAILGVHSKKLILDKNIELKILASQTPGFAGAELANLCNEAALLAARRGKKIIEMEDFLDAIERVIAGLEKRNKLINPKEREIIAYHESGHAIVGWFMENTHPVLKVSIIPRGLSALGYTINTPLEDRYLMTKEELDDEIAVLLGGRIAEEIVFGKVSTGAQNDLERVTNIAYAMVAEYGMSDEMGTISLKDSQNPENSYGFNKKYSNYTAQKIDKSVKDIIDYNYQRTSILMNKCRDYLEKVAQELLKREVLTQKDLEEILGKKRFYDKQTEPSQQANVTEDITENELLKDSQ